MILPSTNFQLSMLTKREQEILRLIACGMISSTIADTLGISVHTVRQHRTNMRRKMDMRHPGALVHYAIIHLGERGAADAGDRQSQLSSREREICRLVGQGFSSDDIAAKLRISPLTVRKHRQNAMRKFGAQNTADFMLRVAHAFAD
jgi:DNA-binding CsgD family transcriptional regulator